MVLFSLLSFIFILPLNGQEKMNVSMGMGYPELLNVGLRYQFTQTQTGFSIGTLPIPDEHNLTVSGDVYFHIGGHSKLSNRRPWYFKTGITYHNLETNYQHLKYIYLCPRIGRDINFSGKIGLQLEAGGSIQIFRKKIRNAPQYFDLDLNFPFLPGFGAALFYRL